MKASGRSGIKLVLMKVVALLIAAAAAGAGTTAAVASGWAYAELGSV